MKILRASEDYLETMLMMKEKHGYIRSIDVASYLGVTKPSVSYATKRLRENGYIKMASDGYITLTPAGREIAEMIYERHTLLLDWLTQLGVTPSVAAEDACRMEHAMSPETFSAIKALALRMAEEKANG